MAIPSAAVTQINAAVVKPFTLMPSLKITPAPKNPIPETMVEAILSPPNCIETSVNRVDTRQIIITVRSPAALLQYYLSISIMVPIPNDISKRQPNSRSISIDVVLLYEQ